MTDHLLKESFTSCVIKFDELTGILLKLETKLSEITTKNKEQETQKQKLEVQCGIPQQ